jgi:hypothetical protein
MSLARAIPIILCGKNPQIATGVKKSLLPEYEGNNPLLPFNLLTNLKSYPRNPHSHSRHLRNPHPTIRHSSLKQRQHWLSKLHKSA